MVIILEDRCVEAAKDIEAKAIGDEILILKPEAGVFFNLNETATKIWENADGKTTIKDIAKKITEQFDVNEETALKDVVDMVKDMERKKLIKLL